MPKDLQGKRAEFRLEARRPEPDQNPSWDGGHRQDPDLQVKFEGSKPR